MDENGATNATKTCPFCGESIRQNAIKCRYCKEHLAGLQPGDRVVNVTSVPSAPKRSSGIGRKIWLGVCVGTIVLFAWALLSRQQEQAAHDENMRRLDDNLRSYEATRTESTLPLLGAKPQIMFDEELAVGADGWNSRAFTIPSTRRVQVTVKGVLNTDNGFNVYVMREEEFETNFRNDREFRHIPGLQSLKTRSDSNTETLPAGSWRVIVVNSENYLRTMSVHLRVVIDP